LSVWNHRTTAGAIRLAKVALRVLQEKGALNLSPEALAREVVDVVYEQAPLESRAMAFQSVLEVTTIPFNELFCIGCGRPELGKLPGEDELAYAARLKFEEAEVANLISSLTPNN
jgi:hypothetical protein